MFQDKTIVVTGGTGSMGKTFVRRVLSGRHGLPKKVIVLSRDEAKQHEMRMDYLHKRVATDEVIYRNFNNVLEFRIGDVRNYSDVCAAIKNADIVVNAAALKQVPTCEYFPVQAVLTNCMGAANIVRAIEENDYPVDTVVGVSTDKACKPINVMGMTKSVQERIFTAANIANPGTRFICVRYGNVLASRGSVIPLFISQILNGGPVTVTVPEMTRFLISLDEAVETVMAAIEHAEPGDTFIPVAPSATVMNIARALVGGRNIAIEVTGIRPGEKMHEVLISEEEAHHSARVGDYYTIRSMLPELANGKRFDREAALGEYSSGDDVLDFEGTVALLRRHKLMVDDVSISNTGELLR
ncbi:MAG: polysaccharide biosynthesis protein [Pseudomonadota bacterium]